MIVIICFWLIVLVFVHIHAIGVWDFSLYVNNGFDVDNDYWCYDYDYD